MGKQNKQVTTQETTSEPWKAAQPYLTDTMENAQNIYNSGTGQQYFPGQTYTGMGATTNNALTQMEQMAGQGGAGVNAANQYVTDTLGGRYLNEGSNPYLANIWNDQADQLTNRLKDVYSGMGRYGSEPMEGELTRNLGALHSQLYGSQYNAERDRMQGAAGMAPGLDAARYQGTDRLLAAGAYRDADTQAARDSEVARWNFNQQAPMNALDWYSQIVNGTAGLGGTTNSTTTEPGPTFLQKLLGGASAIGGLFGML
jgi:hypothetical protein